jgi:hypothetical protein
MHPAVERSTVEGGPVAGSTGLAPMDLLIPFASACRFAAAEATNGSWLDAMLLVAGCSQVVEDEVHRSEGLLDRVTVHLTGDRPDLPAAARAVDVAARGIRSAHRHRSGSARLRTRRDDLLDLAVDLASAIDGLVDDGLAARVGKVLVGEPWPDRLADRPLRLPSCFRSFDQHPADVVALVDRFAIAHPDRGEPVLVAGIRTSGSFLGPLTVAALRAAGYSRVDLVTLRAGEHLDAGQRARAERARQGRVLVVDDPPVSGGTMRDCIRTLEATGIGSDRIILLLAVPDGWSLVPFLARYERILLPGSEWHLPQQLEVGPVTEAARRLLAASGRTIVGDLRPTPDPVGPAPGGAPRTAREHARAAFAIRVGTAQGTDDPIDATLVVRGVGVGLYGRHDAAVAERLPGLVPDVLGVDDARLFELVGPASADHEEQLDPEAAAAYVLGRHRALRVAEDRTAAMSGRKAAWEVAAMIVGDALGPADAALRIPMVQPLVRDLLRVAEPSVIDGRMTADRWLPSPDGRLVKAEHADGAFSNRDLWSYDPIADLSAIGDELGQPGAVLDAWLAQGGAEVDPTRWLLHRLVHAWDARRLGALAQPEYGRRVSAALVDHVGRRYLADLPSVTEGPWCITDVDGVLETGVMSGASSPGTIGATVLRALAAHGHRLVPATGRSVGEVRTRVAAWGLAAGIAEYGTALVIGDETVDLRTPAQRIGVDRARAWLADQPGVVVDPAHGHAVRAWSTGPTGNGRGPLSAALLDGARAAAGVALTGVAGDDQTDLVPEGCSKHAAARALLARLDPDLADADRPFALAAGDGPADVGMLAMSGLAVVPSHAVERVRSSATISVHSAFQAGLSEGVARLLGHEPGSCPACAPKLDAGPAALMELLSTRQAGPRRIPRQVARFVSAAARARR